MSIDILASQISIPWSLNTPSYFLRAFLAAVLCAALGRAAFFVAVLFGDFAAVFLFDALAGAFFLAAVFFFAALAGVFVFFAAFLAGFFLAAWAAALTACTDLGMATFSGTAAEAVWFCMTPEKIMRSANFSVV